MAKTVDQVISCLETLFHTEFDLKEVNMEFFINGCALAYLIDFNARQQTYKLILIALRKNIPILFPKCE